MIWHHLPQPTLFFPALDKRVSVFKCTNIQFFVFWLWSQRKVQDQRVNYHWLLLDNRLNSFIISEVFSRCFGGLKEASGLERHLWRLDMYHTSAMIYLFLVFLFILFLLFAIITGRFTGGIRRGILGKTDGGQQMLINVTFCPLWVRTITLLQRQAHLFLLLSFLLFLFLLLLLLFLMERKEASVSFTQIRTPKSVCCISPCRLHCPKKRRMKRRSWPSGDDVT